MGGMDGIWFVDILMSQCVTLKCWIHSVLNKFDYVFAENGLVAYKNGILIGQMVCTIYNFVQLNSTRFILYRTFKST